MRMEFRKFGNAEVDEENYGGGYSELGMKISLPTKSKISVFG